MKEVFMKFSKVILFSALLSFGANLKAQEIPESGPLIRIESTENLDELSSACDAESVKSDEMATIQIATQEAKMKSLGSSCEKFMQAERRLNHSIRQAKCESLETYVPTEHAIQNCQASLRAHDLKIDEIQADIEHRDVCIVKLKSQY
jgi:hypothetical protein